MTIKKEYFFLLVVIALLGIYIWVSKSNEMHYQLPKLSDLNTEEITKLEITQPEQSIVLKRSKGNWYISPERYLVDQQQMQKLLDSISKLDLTALASTSKAYNRYNLSDAKRIQVKIWEKKSLLRSIDIGKTGANHSTTFVKLPDDPNIYVVNENLKNKFSKNKSRLRDKTVLSFNQNKIQAIKIKNNNQTISFQRDKVSESNPKKSKKNKSPNQYIWKTKDKQKIPSKDVDNLLEIISNLKCSKYLSDKSQIADISPIYSISLENKKSHNLHFYKSESKDSDDYLGTSSGSKDPFIISQYRGKQIVKAIKPLVQKTNATVSE